MKSPAGQDMDSDNGQTVADEALQWFVRIWSGSATKEDHQEFQSWIASDTPRRLEFEKLSALWADLDAIKPVLRDELTHLSVAWEATTQRPSVGRKRGWDIRKLSAVLATLVVVLAAGGWWFTTRVELTEYRTAKGERRTVVLADGSMITMNTETVVAAEFSRSRRAVVLRDGEALFAVSHERDRPFEVTAGNGVVRDVGTQFVMRRQNEFVTVTVVEGAVEVQLRTQGMVATGEPWKVLMAGEQLSYGAQGVLSPVATVAASTAWLDGKVVFEERPLAEAIQEIGRYQSGEIRLLDPSLGDLKISGVFGVNDQEGFLRALQRAVPVAVSRVHSRLVILERKGSPS